MPEVVQYRRRELHGLHVPWVADRPEAPRCHSNPGGACQVARVVPTNRGFHDTWPSSAGNRVARTPAAAAIDSNSVRRSVRRSRFMKYTASGASTDSEPVPGVYAGTDAVAGCGKEAAGRDIAANGMLRKEAAWRGHQIGPDQDGLVAGHDATNAGSSKGRPRTLRQQHVDVGSHAFSVCVATSWVRGSTRGYSVARVRTHTQLDVPFTPTLTPVCRHSGGQCAGTAAGSHLAPRKGQLQ